MIVYYHYHSSCLNIKATIPLKPSSFQLYTIRGNHRFFCLLHHYNHIMMVLHSFNSHILYHYMFVLPTTLLYSPRFCIRSSCPFFRPLHIKHDMTLLKNHTIAISFLPVTSLFVPPLKISSEQFER